jgi:squalene-hopene/tetraprenyl-beta-curcumene cyclase
MGEAGVKDGEVISRTLKYLHNTRKEGMWNARWGINYVYAVGAVFPGLARIGYDLRQPWIANITKRLTEVQQEDGGFGENQ